MAGDSEFSMEGKICLITGGTLGIGLVTAQALTQMGARVIIVGHHEGRGQAALEQIRREAIRPQVEFMLADLSSQAQVRRLAAQLHDRLDHLDVLINNAGGIFIRRQYTVDQIEMTLALNHLAPFLLTHLLLDVLNTAHRARIINVSSAAHQYAALDIENLNAAHGYSGWTVYGQSKLAVLLFTYELARRLKRGEVVANALHPGYVATNFGRNNPGLMGWLFGLSKSKAISAEEGARTPIYLASSPNVEGISGKYFVKCKPVPSSDASYDQETAHLLWEISERMTGIAHPG